MNMILLTKDEFTGTAGRVKLSGRRNMHIREVLKCAIGDELCVGVEGGRIGSSKVTAMSANATELDVSLDREPPKPLGVTLVLALPRPIVFKRLLAQVTALGVKKICLIHSARVEKSYWKSPALTDENIRQQMVLGLEQAKDTIFPEISMHSRFKKFVEEELPGIINGADAVRGQSPSRVDCSPGAVAISKAFVAHPEAGIDCPFAAHGPVTLVIGPEGGFVPSEIDALKTAGCECVKLGERILRVETAVIAAIAKLSM